MVILILSLLMFAVGVRFISKIFTKAQDMQVALDERTEAQILKTLDPGTPVSLPMNRYNLERKATRSIGLGIFNNLGSSKTFFVSVECDAALASDETIICDPERGDSCEEVCSKWIYEIEPVTLENNEKKVVSMFFAVPADALSGDYIFNVEVCTNAACGQGTAYKEYDTIKKLYLHIS